MTHERSVTIIDHSSIASNDMYHIQTALELSRKGCGCLWFPWHLTRGFYSARSDGFLTVFRMRRGASEPLQPTRFCPVRRVGPTRPTSPAGSCAVEPGVTSRHMASHTSPCNHPASRFELHIEGRFQIEFNWLGFSVSPHRHAVHSLFSITYVYNNIYITSC